MTVTAEGVETAEVMTLLSGMGADAAQGYFIARPQDCATTLAFLETFMEDRPARITGPAEFPRQTG